MISDRPVDLLEPLKEEPEQVAKLGSGSLTARHVDLARLSPPFVLVASDLFSAVDVQEVQDLLAELVDLGAGTGALRCIKHELEREMKDLVCQRRVVDLLFTELQQELLDAPVDDELPARAWLGFLRLAVERLCNRDRRVFVDNEVGRCAGSAANLVGLVLVTLDADSREGFGCSSVGP